MVAIKIQSLDDIVRAYLQNLGFEGKKLSEAVDSLVGSLGDKYNTDNVLLSLDELIYKATQQVFGKQKMAKEQKIAMFKLCFLLNDGAKKWDVATLLGSKLSEDMIAKMQEKVIKVAPLYKLSVMKPQVIETAKPIGVFKKIIHHSKKV